MARSIEVLLGSQRSAWLPFRVKSEFGAFKKHYKKLPDASRFARLSGELSFGLVVMTTDCSARTRIPMCRTIMNFKCSFKMFHDFLPYIKPL